MKMNYRGNESVNVLYSSSRNESMSLSRSHSNDDLYDNTSPEKKQIKSPNQYIQNDNKKITNFNRWITSYIFPSLEDEKSLSNQQKNQYFFGVLGFVYFFCALFLLYRVLSLHTLFTAIEQHIRNQDPNEVDMKLFSKINSPHPNYCPFAICHNSPTCKPCQRRFLIIIATGRSGSTTLTNMLGQLPNVRLAGENNGQLLHSMRHVTNLEDTVEFGLHSKTGVDGAWKHFPIPEQSLACPIQDMYEHMNPPHRDVFQQMYEMEQNKLDASELDSKTIIGFKTVRLHDIQFGDDYSISTNFLIENFPCAKFVVNIRGDVKSQMTSWFKAFGTELDGEKIRQYNRRLENVAAHMGEERARLIDMSTWSRKDGSGLYVLNDLIKWLGFKDCSFQSLVHSNFDGKYGQSDEKVFLGDNCRPP